MSWQELLTIFIQHTFIKIKAVGKFIFFSRFPRIVGSLIFYIMTAAVLSSVGTKILLEYI
jgi:hypothetical protein